MLSTYARLSIISLAVLCVACAQKQEAWQSYSDTTTGVSLSYPKDFNLEPTADTQIANGTGSYTLKQVRIRQKDQTAYISILKADNPALLYSLTTDGALLNVTIGGKSYKKFTMNGAGTPTGYVLQEEPSPIVIAFSYITDQAFIDRVMESIELK